MTPPSPAISPSAAIMAASTCRCTAWSIARHSSTNLHSSDLHHSGVSSARRARTLTTLTPTPCWRRGMAAHIIRGMSVRPPHVSIIVPAYNAAATLGAALDSALAQTYRDFELLAVDDGSTDNTAAILDRYGESIRVIRQAN